MRKGIVMLALGLMLGCNRQEAKTAIDVIDATCTDEAADPAAPGWVAATCGVIDAATGELVGTRPVRMARRVWEGTRAAGMRREVRP